MSDSRENESTPLLNHPSSRPGKVRGALVVVGGILLHLTFGTMYTFGNMTPYITSYLRANHVSDVTYANSVWIFSVSLFGEGVAMFFGGVLERRFGPRAATFIGSVILSSGVCLTYFTVTSSFLTVVVTYGLMFGIGKGVGYVTPLACAMRWFPERMGLVSGLVVAGIGGGSFIFDQIQTAYLNPRDEKPTFQYPGDTDNYFNQPDILNRVPVCFLLLGGVYAGLQLIGIILLTNPPSYTSYVEEVSADPGEEDLTDVVRVNQSDEATPVIRRELKPSAMLRTRRFYHLWITLLLVDQALVFVSSLWKAYGQTFIDDDRFLAYVGAFSSVGNGLGRILWGHVGDRTSFKVGFLGVLSSFAVVTLTVQLSPYGGRPFFFVWVFLIFLSFSGTFALLPPETTRAFGSKYYTMNYGLMLSAGSLAGVLGAVLPSTLQSLLGWNWMFVTVASLVCLGLVLVYVYKPLSSSKHGMEKRLSGGTDDPVT